MRLLVGLGIGDYLILPTCTVTGRSFSFRNVDPLVQGTTTVIEASLR